MSSLAKLALMGNPFMHAYLDAGQTCLHVVIPSTWRFGLGASAYRRLQHLFHLLWSEVMHAGCTCSVWEDVPAPFGRTLQQRIVVPFPVEAPLSGVEPSSLPLSSAHVHSGLQYSSPAYYFSIMLLSTSVTVSDGL